MTHTYGPDRIAVAAIPGGATIDVSTYLTRVILALINDEAGALYDIADLDESAAHYRSHGNDDSHAAHERDALIEELVERLAPRLPVYGAEVSGLAVLLREIAAPKPVPSQREAGAA